MPAGTHAAVQASAVFADGSTQDVTALATWSTGNTSIATVTSGSVAGVSKGSSQVQATYSGRSASAQITVTDAVLSALAIQPGSLSLAAGLTQQLAAGGTFTDGSARDLAADATWTSSDPSVAAIGAGGLLRAVAPGQATITAAALGISAVARVTVTSALVTSIAVAPGAASIARGSTVPLVATATYSDGATANVSSSATWTSSDASVVSTEGAVATGVATGTADVTASLQGKGGSAHLKVAAITAIAVSPQASAVAEGHTVRLSAVATLDDGHSQDVSSSAAWTSSNPDAALVSMDAATRGLVSTLAPGLSTITASLDSMSAGAEVNVSRLVATVSAPVFQMGEDGVITLQAQASSFIPPSTPVVWQLTLIRNAPSGALPDSGQSIYWYGGASGEDPAIPSTWTTSAATDGSGVGLLGPASGTAIAQTGLAGDAGQTLKFRTQFAIKGDYSLALELFDFTDPSAPMSVGSTGTSHVTVGTIRITGAGELLLYSAAPSANPQSNAEAFPQAFSVHPDGTGQTQLTPAPTPFQPPRDDVSELTRSPDGKTIAWTDGRDIPLGRRVPYFAGLVYLADADGSNVRRLTTADRAACQERSPQYSPDGQWVAFVRACTPDPGGRAAVEFEYIVHPDGTGERRILVPGVNDMPPPQPIDPVVYGTFSRDSATLYVVDYAVGNSLWAYSIADGSSQLLVNYSDPNGELASILKFPMVLPGGDLLYEYSSFSVSTDVWLERIHPDGTGRQIVRPVDVDPDFLVIQQQLFTLSPDGTKVAYQAWSDPDQAWVVQVANLDGSGAQTVSSPTSFIRRISWVP